MKTELLAPAGDVEAGYAALYYGADAVYLGLQQFSARATATNFTSEALADFTGYAHSLNRKVYVTVNTLIQEAELKDLLQTLEACCAAGVDGIILQDLGVARVIRNAFPELELHASTQMAVHNKEGALALQKLGFSRVVLARELSLKEIKEIAALPNLETEAFIHGALCYSYSGLCLFSSMETGKSANRGKCLYPCRSCFEGKEGSGHLFSMKDMALCEDVLKMPVTSLKIEGRKKSALYVAAVTDFYRKILDGKGVDIHCEENIRQIFSRPWTKFHFVEKNKDVVDRDFVGHRGLEIGSVEAAFQGKLIFHTTHAIARYDGLQIDVAGSEKPFGFSLEKMRLAGRSVFEAKAGDMVEVSLPPKAPFIQKGEKIYLASSTAVKGAYPYKKPKSGAFMPKKPLCVELKIMPSFLEAKAMDKVCKMEGNFEVAQNPEKTNNAAQQAFSKTDQFPFYLSDLKVDNPQSLFVPVSILNELRRQLYQKLEIQKDVRVFPSLPMALSARKKAFALKTDSAELLKELDLSQMSEIIYLLNPQSDIHILKDLPKNKVRLALPTVCRHPMVFAPLVEKLLEQGYKKWEIGNVWGLSILPKKGIDISFDTPLYMMNTQAFAMAKEIGATRACFAIEDTLENIQKLDQQACIETTFVIYQDVPLFTSAVCVRSNACQDCLKGKKWFEIKQGKEQYDILSQNCETKVFGRKPLCLAKEAASVPADFYRIDFVDKTYSVERAAYLIKELCQFKDVPNISKGNMFRRL